MLIDPKKFHVSLSDPIARCFIVNKAIGRYMKLFFDDIALPDRDRLENIQLANLDQLYIDANLTSSGFKCQNIPNESMDESYTLTVGPFDKATLRAHSSWGIIRGLETFSQLIYRLPYSDNFGVNPVDIKDEPRFSHRGFMLDTARHYISLSKIRTMIDAMAFNKLNVFHWHMVDDQSFPFKSSIFPQLAKETSFRPNMTYSKEEVRDIIEFAGDRGIRVIPEIDSPGHTYALRFIPNMLTKCYNESSGKPTGDLGPVDPSNDINFRNIESLIAEFGSLFYDSMFHAGGDEVELECWKSNPDINRWMAAKNISGQYTKLSNLYLNRIYDILMILNKTMLVWQEAFDNQADLPKDTIIQVWKFLGLTPLYMQEMKQVIESGYRAILSSCWYMNYIDYGQDWVKFYQCDPADRKYIEPNLSHLVLGGEICMWSEFVDDTNVITRSWPRASAAAERLWSASDVIDLSDFMHRLEQIRCRMQFRGIAAEPINGPGYC